MMQSYEMNFNKIVQYNFPTIIRFGAGVSKELGAYLIKNGLSRPLIVTDPTVSQLSFFREIMKRSAADRIFPWKYFMISIKIR